MASKIIYCRDCEQEKFEIEESGALEVVSCEPLPDQDDVPDDERQCEIRWRPA